MNYYTKIPALTAVVIVIGLLGLFTHFWNYGTMNQEELDTGEGILYFKETIERQYVRQKLVWSQCKELNLRGQVKNLTDSVLGGIDFLVDDSHRVLLNTVDGTDCKSWRSLLINNAPHKVDMFTDPFDKDLYHRIGLGLLSDCLHKESMYKVAYYYSILTVMHPLRRLESVFMENYLRTLAEGERKSATMQSHTSMASAFEEFLEDLFKHFDENTQTTPFYAQSYLCTIQYSFIAKMESVDADMEYILNTRLSGLGTTKHMAKTASEDDIGEPLTLFNLLDNKALYVNKFSHKYYQDMKLFGYDIADVNGTYYATCKDGSKTC